MNKTKTHKQISILKGERILILTISDVNVLYLENFIKGEPHYSHY